MLDLSKEIYNSRFMLKKKCNKFNYLLKKTYENKNRTFKIRTKRVQKNMICKNLNKKIPTNGEINVSNKIKSYRK